MYKNNNEIFTSKYNMIDNYLKNIVRLGDERNLISYLERIINPKDSSMLKTLRNYKNTVDSHSSLPGYQKPVVPQAWISFLDHIMKYCENNRDYVKRKLTKLLYSNKRSFKCSNTKRPNRPKFVSKPRLTKCDFCPFSENHKCTNYAYYYQGKKASYITRYGMAMGGEKRKEPCPSSALRKFEEYLNRQRY